ncbi:nesprin-2 isoform X2 [Cheilinus undulatus]|uniref:nesprin-2 isoform X2 n=1 Tax=Cheilinus undulatus TaxID=241271 RepID=UPI001BD50D3A|nr:nesprin-2 isoform X2 [Cheilinus undulatus]
MPGSPTDPAPLECHSGVGPFTAGYDANSAEEVMEMELLLDLSTSPPLEEGTEEVDSSWSQDGDLQGCGQLERRWVLWHEFMKEHAHLDTWLRLAEQAVSSPNPAYSTYLTAKEELRKFKRLRCEAGSLLIRLDGLTRRNRTLTRLFQGAMRARLLASTRHCGQRWDDVNAKLESITARLQVFVSEWEEFEAEREELGLWLADLDVRLSEVDHLTGNTCEKLRRLQSFQQCVCMNSARVNALLQRGEVLIQRTEPTDAQYVENRLLELLRSCSLAYNNIARTHTRLLSMRLVFEDDWILSQATDSGCPSESLLEEEGALDKTNLDLPAYSNHQKVNARTDFPSGHLRPPRSPSSPTHEHLEWDPSVDVGRSVSRDDADSSYFSVSTGLCHRDGLKRRSYLSSLGSLGSQSDINNDLNNQEADLPLEGRHDHTHPGLFSPIALHEGEAWLNGDQWTSSTPDRETLSFDGGRVRAWLGDQSSAPPVRKTSCCKAVQTDGEAECFFDGSCLDATNNQLCNDQSQQPFPDSSSSLMHLQEGFTDQLKHQRQSNLQSEEEQSYCEESERCFSGQSVTSSSRAPSSSLLSPTFLYLLASLLFLGCLIWVVLEPPCQRSSRMPRSFHLALRYVNGPPPT